MNGPLAHADALNRDSHATRPPRPMPTLRSLLPWGVSLAIHAVLVVLALLLIAAVVSEPQTEAGVQSTQTAQAAPALDTHQLVYYDTRAALRDVIELPRQRTPVAAVSPRAPRPTPERRDTATVMEDARTLGQTITEAKRFADEVALPGHPPLIGPRTNAGHGPFNLALPPLTDEAERPRRVVYLIDASGSLVDTFPFIIEQVSQSVTALPTGDMFTVIFFRDGQVVEQRPLGLKEATPGSRLDTIAWMATIHASGRTSPVPALERALSYRPDDVILMADNITAGSGGIAGMRQEQARILDIIAQTSRGARVHTIQFLYADPLTGVPGMEGTLATIARQTDGQHLFVRDSDLYLRSAAR